MVWAVPPVVVRRRLDYRPFCTLQPAPSVIAAAPLATTLPVELSAADRARVDAALRDSRAANTRAQYRSAWRGWAEWSALNGHATLPADPLTVAAYLPWTGQHQHTTLPPPEVPIVTVSDAAVEFLAVGAPSPSAVQLAKLHYGTAVTRGSAGAGAMIRLTFSTFGSSGNRWEARNVDRAVARHA